MSGRTAWLVTGAGGQLGTDLLDVLSTRPDDDVTGLRRAQLDLTDEDGVPVKQWGVVQDVSERVEAVRTLAENEEVFRLTFDRAPIGMLMLDLVDPGRVLRSNASFRTMTRRPGDDTDDPLLNYEGAYRIIEG